jgi:homocysteine S-methyltransferase
MIWAVTINNVSEALAISRAAASVGLSVKLFFTLDSTHKLKSGPSLSLATDAQASAARPDSYGINCSHPAEFNPALENRAWADRIRLLRLNAAAMDKISLCKLERIEEGDPEELGKTMGDLATRYPNIDIWGGCCGPWDKHFDCTAHYVRKARITT